MDEKKMETQVGAFVLVGLLVLGILVVAFGRVGSWLNPTYPIVVQFDNASGVIKNSQVLYRGAKVGTVSDKPRIQAGGKYVALPLEIHSAVKIPANASFQVGSYGLLGDRFVNILPPTQESGEFLSPGAEVVGMPSTGINDLAAKAEPVIQRLDAIASKLETEIFTPAFASNLNATIKNANSTMQRVDSLLADAQGGKGILYTVMKDPSAAADLKETLKELRLLSYNLRVKGVLFYSDVSTKKAEEEARAKEKKK
ncbi:MAG: MlaD family protein [Candidatus Methylacidiphilales bacterium]|nr:MlaD family protein [Candidatus Methylacidiphilales bacterium]